MMPLIVVLLVGFFVVGGALGAAAYGLYVLGALTLRRLRFVAHGTAAGRPQRTGQV